ncbi:metal-sulfur cluster assembly factor [Methanosphaera sp.]
MAESEIRQTIQDKLALIADPHMGISIVEMGLVREIDIDEANKKADITLSPTNPGCMSIANIAMAARLEVEKLDGIDKAEIKVIDHMMADTINEMVNKDE